jgi:hypothetical protein
MDMQVVGVMVCKFEHWGFNRAKERWDSASLGAKDFKNNYAKDKLRANMGQCQPKERGLKQGFKELQGAKP